MLRRSPAPSCSGLPPRSWPWPRLRTSPTFSSRCATKTVPSGRSTPGQSRPVTCRSAGGSTRDLTDRQVRGEALELARRRTEVRGRPGGRVPLLRELPSPIVISRRTDATGATARCLPRRDARVIEGGVRPRPGDPVDLYATFDPQTVGADVEPTLTIAHGVPGHRGRPRDRVGLGDAGARDRCHRPRHPDEAKRLAFATAAGTLRARHRPTRGCRPVTDTLPA